MRYASMVFARFIDDRSVLSLISKAFSNNLVCISFCYSGSALYGVLFYVLGMMGVSTVFLV